jgi:hypothetical protein
MYAWDDHTPTAAVTRCDGCRRPLTAEHVLSAGAHRCYGCGLRLLKEQDLAGLLVRQVRLPRRRRRSLYPPIPYRPVYGIAARRPGAPFVRLRPRSVP